MPVDYRPPVKRTARPERVYVIYDERAQMMSTDDCCVLESCGSLAECGASDWDGIHGGLGIVFGYDLVPSREPNGPPEAVNEQRMGTVPELRAALGVRHWSKSRSRRQRRKR